MSMTIKVEIDTPDGVEIDTREYNREHPEGVTDPDLYGGWAFAPEGADPDDMDALIWRTGNLRDVVDELEPGTYVLCP